MGMFSRDSGYKGPVDQHGNKTNEHADIFAALAKNTDRAIKRGQK
ncbi:hypothetical protein [Micromonospora peucetia]|uniref:Uncharacterized protein n=1 Tax=Micromonospora peucetia TaxID=47871 RepID=A0ABZ1EJX0_9ACTN|nr:hypothetical protein [Micromonospora peucetia]WSA34567.1 hypothetical protein OIE14_11235 [Micromonospora peucetia]